MTFLTGSVVGNANHKAENIKSIIMAVSIMICV